MMDVLAVSGEWRLARLQSAQHGQREIEQREHQNCQRQNQQQKRRHGLVVAHDRWVDLTGDREGRGRH